MEEINSHNNHLLSFSKYKSKLTQTTGMLYKQLMVTFLLVLVSNATIAKQEKHLLAGSSRISTQGLGGELNMTLNKKVELMAGLNIADVGFGLSHKEQNYDGMLYLNTLYTGMRVHPWENGLYFGGAVALNNNKIKLKPKIKDEEYVFNDKRYNAKSVGSVKTTGTFFKVSPMLLAGWESRSIDKTGLSFFGEVGVMISTPPSFELDVLCSQMGASSCDQVRQNFRVEQESVEKKLIPLLAYPIVGAGVRFRF